mmetsp:Transcript_18361/g.51192  ORF Transcript_18361/g.51192 Transcript_18361/m.51192 type:complete len:81 (+) Transcript_18361:1527-1769(+)
MDVPFPGSPYQCIPKMGMPMASCRDGGLSLDGMANANANANGNANANDYRILVGSLVGRSVGRAVDRLKGGANLFYYMYE